MDKFRKVDVPEGESGEWKVSCFTPEGFSAQLHNLKQPGRQLVVGETYTQLTHCGDVVMSDTPAEINDLWPFNRHLRGRLLINGLGLGVVLQGALDTRAVLHVTVIELSASVIALVARHYEARYGSERLNIINADALDWAPPKGVRYDAVWHDIWDNICGDNWEPMKKLHRKYGRRCAWQDSWCRALVKRASVA